MALDMSGVNACKVALYEAARTDEPAEAIIERIHAEHGGVITREAMLVGISYCRATFAAQEAKAAAIIAERAQRFKLAMTDDVACLELLADRLPGIIERLKAEPRP